MQFESEPAGAEARTSLGQTCRTPCSLAVAANEFTVSFTLPGYQPQTVPVRIVASTEAAPRAKPAPPRLVPNPVFVELTPGRARGGGAAPPVSQTKPKPSPRRSPPPHSAPRRPRWRPQRPRRRPRPPRPGRRRPRDKAGFPAEMNARPPPAVA